MTTDRIAAFARNATDTDAKYLYPLADMYERLHGVDAIRDENGDIDSEREAFFARVHGTGTLADYMRVDAIPAAFAEAA